MEQYAFVIIYKEESDVKYQLLIASSHKDAYETFKFEYLENDLNIVIILSVVDIQQKIKEINALNNESKFVENEKGEVLEIKPHHVEYEKLNNFMSKNQLLDSFIQLLDKFDVPSDSYLISNSMDVQWK